MARVKTKEIQAEEQRSFYFRNKKIIQKRRNKESPSPSNINEVNEAQNIQERNSEIFSKSYYGKTL